MAKSSGPGQVTFYPTKKAADEAYKALVAKHKEQARNAKVHSDRYPKICAAWSAWYSMPALGSPTANRRDVEKALGKINKAIGLLFSALREMHGVLERVNRVELEGCPVPASYEPAPDLSSIVTRLGDLGVGLTGWEAPGEFDAAMVLTNGMASTGRGQPADRLLGRVVAAAMDEPKGRGKWTPPTLADLGRKYLSAALGDFFDASRFNASLERSLQRYLNNARRAP